MAGKIAEQKMDVARRAVFRQNHIAAEGRRRANHTLNVFIADIVLLHRIVEHLLGNFLFAMNQAVHALYLIVESSDALHCLNLALQQEAIIGLDQKIIAAGIDTGLQ